MTPRRNHRALLLVGVMLSAACLTLGLAARSHSAEPMEQEAAFSPADVEFFEKQVRPLLVTRCHECHGPHEPKAGLRLDSRAGVLAGGDTGAAVVPGKPDESLLVDAIRYGDTYQMPPKSQMPAAEIGILEEWVRRGVPWGQETPASETTKAAGTFDLAARGKHWSFQPLKQTEPPAVRQADWPRTTVDNYIVAGLEAVGLTPAAPADRQTLLRRVTFDLIGLPPTPEEIAAFTADTGPGAYARVVERLLASPHYGERWARHWLDLVRYAETWGHEFDFEIPNAYRYRDYVIRALNADLPYDQFVTEHIAGDLLQRPRRNAEQGFNESTIATGWYFFGEAVHSPVDVRADEATRVDNQIDVLAKTFLGLTVSCARCHDHKFDAISTKDYYALAGYLQSSRYDQTILDEPGQQAKQVAPLQALAQERTAAFQQWVREVLEPRAGQVAARLLQPSDKGAVQVALDRKDHVLHAWASLTSEGSGSEFATRRAELATRLKAPVAPAAPKSVIGDFSKLTFDGWLSTGAAFGEKPAGAFEVVPAAQPTPARVLGVAAAHSGRLSARLQGTLRSPTFEITQPTIWYRVYGQGGRVRLILDGLQLIQDPIYGGLKFEPNWPEARWHAQDVSKWVGHRAYVEVMDEGDGFVALEQVVQSAASPATPAANRWIAGLLDDASVTSAESLAARYQAVCQQVVREYLAQGSSGATVDAADRAALLIWLMEQPATLDEAAGHSTWQATMARIDERQRAVEAQLVAPMRAVALTDGTAENEHVFIRGSHKTLGDEVPRRFLEVLGGTKHQPPTAGSGRLELANQLVSADDPLVSRVIVNRLWHHHFGAGLVRSPDDFGVMGQPPTHPELLDHLAGELVRSGWSLKHVHRLMVMSNTYQMSSRATPAADELDPQNKLWHRMTVRRLEAEAIRDAVLAVSGRADPKMYGPGVMPHLTEFMNGRGRPKESGPLDGDGRRSIYLSVRRNFLSPLFLAFDYPTPFTTMGRRGTSNVPAQALAMMNNAFVIEQARVWAHQVAQSGEATPEARVQAMYVKALGRAPEPEELRQAVAFVSESQVSGEPERAWADLAHVLFNVKEFIYIP